MPSMKEWIVSRVLALVSMIKVTTLTWLIVKATPPPRDGAKKLAAAAYSPLLLSPSVWQASTAMAGERGGGSCCWRPVAAQLRRRLPPAQLCAAARLGPEPTR
uniref:Uncharacterized protein n=1 Tax=Oryza barthii TaxID=65489 RepID=A0A0D3FUE9_9ORYZ